MSFRTRSAYRFERLVTILSAQANLALLPQQILPESAANGRKPSMFVNLCDTQLGGDLTIPVSRFMRLAKQSARKPPFYFPAL